MAQGDFEEFKQEIKSWMDAHPDKYDAFVEEVNDKSFDGIQRVYMLAMRLAPQLMAKAKQQVHGDLNRTEPDDSIFTADDTLAPQLVAEFRNTEKTSVVPAVLAWLYYGRCYETMVERLEELIDESHSRIYKWICGFMIKFVIRSSIRNKMCTREDWEQYRCERETSPLDAAIESLQPKDKELTDEKAKQGARKADIGDVMEYWVKHRE